MIISDLSHLEIITEKVVVVGSAGTFVDTTAAASGDSTYTNTKTIAMAKMFPSGTSVAIGIGRGFAIASDPEDAIAYTTVDGSAQGDFTKVIEKTHSVDVGKFAVAGGVVVSIGISHP